ncbi:MAG: hypothetical protein DWQ07_01615 [Chloroflexi bacterium]|nr:MAG: hypothetical protein DWQ07_01615 [Chloroflexota bacterium]MBL1193805.1 hypothetical protein [Chloroflexota bacterium]NOH11098.1 hypothetical protein [Chloroflexota bacterium]
MIKRAEFTMSGRERMQALFNREPLDYVTYVHRGYSFCANNAGVAKADIYDDPQKSFDAQMWTNEQYNSDGSPFYTFVSYGAWEFGGTIEWPDDRWGSGPGVEKVPIESPEQLWDLELPDVKTAGSVPKMMEFAKLQEAAGLPIGFVCGSPFTHAANLCGINEFMMWIVENPDAVHKAMRLMTDHILQVADYFVDTFGKGNVIARSAAPTESLIGPKQFEEFVKPYVTELHSKVLDKGAKYVYCHICGEQNHLLDQWAEVPFGERSVLSFGHEVPLEKAAEYFPDHIIAGNTDPQIIAQGHPDEVREALKQTIETGKKLKNGYIFMGGCSLPASTPPYKVFMMSKAREEFGRFD